MQWGLVVVGVCVGCSRYEPPRDAPPSVAVVAPHAADARVQIVKPSEVTLVEVSVDVPIYPVSRAPRRTDASGIHARVQYTLEHELDRIAACANDRRSAAVHVWCEIDQHGVAHHVRARATLTSPVQDDARDRCMEQAIARIRFP